MSKPVRLKIRFKSGSLDEFVRKYSLDVSKGGIFIRTRKPLDVGTKVRFEFLLQDDSPLMSGEGTVVWIREHDPARTNVAPGMGVRFDVLTPESEKVLKEILRRKELPPEEEESIGVPELGAAPKVGPDEPALEAAGEPQPAAEEAPTAEGQAEQREEPKAPAAEEAGGETEAASKDEEAVEQAEKAAEEPASAGGEEPESAELGGEAEPAETAEESGLAAEKAAEEPGAEGAGDSEGREEVGEETAEAKAEPAARAKPAEKPSEEVRPAAKGAAAAPVTGEEEPRASAWLVVVVLALVVVGLFAYLLVKKMRSSRPKAEPPRLASTQPRPQRQVARPQPVDAAVPRPVDAAPPKPPRPACEGVLVKVTTEPPGAEVWVDGKAAGRKTPAELCFQPGRRPIIEFKKDGYWPQKAGGVKVVQGLAVHRKLERIPYTVLVRTSPKRARIYVDGKDYGCVTTCNVRLPDDRDAWEITVKKRGYEDASFQLRKGSPAFKLERRYGFRARKYLRLKRMAGAPPPRPEPSRPVARPAGTSAASPPARVSPPETRPARQPSEARPRPEPSRPEPRETPAARPRPPARPPARQEPRPARKPDWLRDG